MCGHFENIQLPSHAESRDLFRGPKPQIKYVEAFVTLDGLQVVTWDQPGKAISAVDLGLPPSIVLVAENRHYITLVEAKLLRDGRLIHIHSTRWKVVSANQLVKEGREAWRQMH